MTSKIDINATEVPMDINATAKSPVEINKGEFTIDTGAIVSEKIHITPQSPDYHFPLYINSGSSTSK